MDLIPRPDQVVSAVGNVVHSVLWGGLADLRPMPRAPVGEGPMRQVHHYRPAAGVPETGGPVLLVAPLAAPATCYDLRRGCSLVEHLVAGGRPTYLVDYGPVSFADRRLAVDPWVDQIVPEAVREVAAHAGGRPVHLVGWGLGGAFAVLAAAGDAGLPVASVTVLGTPFDVTRVPLVAPAKPILDLDLPAGWRPVARVYQALGGTPAPLRWALDIAAGQRILTRPLAIATHLDDSAYLAQLEAVDRFQSEVVAYHGRTFGQVYHRFLGAEGFRTGTVELAERTVALSALTAPVLVIAGTTDGIAPASAVRALVPMLTGSREARYEIVPGGHLGLLTGREARRTTWVAMDEWLDQWSGRDASPAPKRPARKRPPAKKAPAKKAPAKRAPAKKVPAKKVPAKKVPADKATAREIGSNPQRRFDSKSSRGLAPRKSR